MKEQFRCSNCTQKSKSFQTSTPKKRNQSNSLIMKEIFLLFCFTAVSGFLVDSTIRTVEHFLMELKATITVDAMICWSHGERFPFKFHSQIKSVVPDDKMKFMKALNQQNIFVAILQSIEHPSDLIVMDISCNHSIEMLRNVRKCCKKSLNLTTEQLYSFHYRI